MSCGEPVDTACCGRGSYPPESLPSSSEVFTLSIVDQPSRLVPRATADLYQNYKIEALHK